LATVDCARSWESGNSPAEKSKKKTGVRTNRQRNKAYKQGARTLTQGLGVGILDHLTKGNLGRHKNSISVPLHLSQLLLLLKLPAQLPFGLSEVFFGLPHLGLTSGSGIL
jgi:hypothetical protein